jgi:predicted nucleic acid-binding protein
MKLQVYLDTSVFSAYLDDTNPERMNLTRYFWKCLKDFDVNISEQVLAEIAATPDAKRKQKLENLTKGLRVLSLTSDAEELSFEYLRHGAVPERFRNDAIHLSIATLQGMDYLLSWNFKHLVNEKTRRIVNMVNQLRGLRQLLIVTPPEML